jgi:uncharacterized peroxidase-related enzyme
MTHTAVPDLIDHLLALDPASPVYALRHQRDKVVASTQGSLEAIFDPTLTGLSLTERLLAAQRVAQLSGSAELAAYYASRLKGLPPVNAAARAETILQFAQVLTQRPVEGDREALLELPAAGLATADVVCLAQLIAFVAYQVRVLAGLKALADAGEVEAAAPTPESAPFVHPAQLPPPGEPLRIQGYTSESLGWKSWLPVLDLAQATPKQLEVLRTSHPKAASSDYYLLLVQQARILEERSVVFNAIMYAPGGLSRAERELASTVVSRINGCVYCASVHAQRFEQLVKRNDVIAQVFEAPQGAGTTAREQAIVRASIELTQSVTGFGATSVQALIAVGLSALEVLDLIHAIAIFAWANRLMLNLGEPVFPDRAP